MGSFRYFLRWTGHKYRVRIEVMGTDTPNILSRETTFSIGILKKCLPVEKVPIEQDIMQNNLPNNMQNSSISVPCSTPGHSGHSVPSTEGVFCHSVMPAEENLPCHSVPSTEEGSQMNCASISDTVQWLQ